MCSSRTLLIDERVDIRRGLHRQERHLFLFNDMFVVAKVKYNNNLKIKKTIKLSDMWVASHMDEVEEGSTSAMESFILGWPTINFAVSFRYNNDLKIQNKIKLSDMWTASCVDEVGEDNTSAARSFVLGWPTINFVVTF
ncbi:hypothetical protein CB1_001153001, partial [Camelus ferus]